MSAQMFETNKVDMNEYYKAYRRSGMGVKLGDKHLRKFKHDFVKTSNFSPEMSVLELGCGNGLFLQFLNKIGTNNFLGVDRDARILDEISPELQEHVLISDFADFFASTLNERFDRVVLFDVLEHFSLEKSVELLQSIRSILFDDGRIVIRIPNLSSPFSLEVQFNDVTHRTAFTPGSIAQVAKVAGYETTGIYPQAYASWRKEMRERLLTRTLSWFLAMPPTIWSPLMIVVLKPSLEE